MAELSRMQNRRKRNKKRVGRIQKAIILSLFSLAILVFVFAIYANEKANEFINNISEFEDEPPTIVDMEPIEREYTNNAFAMVVVGFDSRAATGSLNTDVLIVAVVEPEAKNVTMMSIPRDTVVSVPGYSGYHKINSVYATGESDRRQAERKEQPVTVTGTSLLKKTIEGFLGIPVKHYVTVDFNGFISVIDALGGIEVDVERRLVYHDPTDGTAIDLQKGLQILDGKKALDYVRHREDDRGSKYYSSDFDRNARQQLVIKKMVDKMKSFSGITKIFDVMDAADDHIRTDLSEEKIKGLAKDFISIGSENITTLETGAYWDSKIGYTVFPTDKLEEIRKLLWSKLGISEEDGRAKILEENEKAVAILTERAKQAAKEAAAKKAAEEAAQAQQQNEANEVAAPPDENSSSVGNSIDPNVQSPTETGSGTSDSTNEPTTPATDPNGSVNDTDPNNGNG